MNEFLRICKRTFQKFGYDLKKAGKFTLQPLSNDSYLYLTKVYEAFDADRPASGKPEKLDKLVVFIRTCLRSNRNIDKTPRFTGASIEETVYRCLKSTIASINYAFNYNGQQENAPKLEVIILDDHSDKTYFQKIEKLCQGILCPWSLQTTREAGQGNSLLEQFERARSLDALCYFCEDDYLHEPFAIKEMWEFYRQIHDQTKGHLVLSPQEGDFLYQTYYPSYIVASETRHWRTMAHATHVLFTHGTVVRDYWKYFENTQFVGNRQKRHLGAESKTTNLLFNHMPGFCPLPALAGHAQFKGTLPPCFDWQKIWNEYPSNEQGQTT